MLTNFLSSRLGKVCFVVCSNLIFFHASADTEPPQIVHDIITEQVADSNPYSISATVTDSEAVATVVLYYKYRDASEYKTIQMQSQNGSSRYAADIPAAELAAPGLDYFISAEDTSGNKQFRGFDFDPLQITVFAPLQVNANENQATSSGVNRTLWYIVGAALLVGVAAGASGGSSSSPEQPTNTTTFVFER